MPSVTIGKHWVGKSSLIRPSVSRTTVRSDMLLDEFFRDYGGKEFPLPEIAGKYADKNKVLIIAGDAACVWDDIERAGGACRVRFGHVGGPFDYMTVNKLVEVF